VEIRGDAGQGTAISVRLPIPAARENAP
jgi:hypothetical protein